MNDMSAVIIPKSDQINADDLIPGPMTITIREVHIKRGDEQPVDIYFDGSDKAYRPCKSMSRVLTQIWGLDAGKYNGRSLTLFRDPKVRFGKDAVGGIRISHMSDIPEDLLDNGRVVLPLMVTRGQRKPYVVQPLKTEPKQPGEDPAAKWARTFISKVDKAAGRAEMEQFVEQQATRLAELGEKRPELHQQCLSAIEDARAVFAPERKPDEAHGDQFDGADGDEWEA